ncbi:MAG: proton-conducting transporter membrane subunit [Rickettsiales bacterium]
MPFALWTTLVVTAPLWTALVACLPLRDKRRWLVVSALTLPIVALWGFRSFVTNDGTDAPSLWGCAWFIAPAALLIIRAFSPTTKALVGATLYAGAAFYAFSAVLRVGSLKHLSAFVDASSGAIDLAFALEPLSAAFVALIALLWPPTLLYASKYMEEKEEPSVNRFLFFYALSVAATLGLALARNAYTLFLFYEILSLATFPLVTHAQNDDARRAGRTYLGVLLFGSLALLLPGLAVVYSETGSLDFIRGGRMQNAPSLVVFVALALCTLGAAKAAIMPMHRWLPAAMIAPAPVSAMLHAVAVVKAGVFAVLKISAYLIGAEAIRRATLDLFGGANPLIYLACATTIIASVVALSQDNIKKMLAYSTVSQLSYIVAAALIASPRALQAGAVHMMAHGFAKITLFFCAGAIYVASKKTRLSEMDGLAKTMPYTCAAFSVAALSMIGLPPGAGFWGKWHIFAAAYGGGYYSVIATLVVSTVLNAMYFLPIVRRFYFVGPSEESAGRREAPPAMLLALWTTLAFTVFFFLAPEGMQHLTDQLTTETVDGK